MHNHNWIPDPEQRREGLMCRTCRITEAEAEATPGDRIDGGKDTPQTGRRPFKKWNTWLSDVKIEIVEWDGHSTGMARLLTGDEFRRVRDEDGVLELGSSRYCSDRFVRPGDLLARDASGNDHTILVLPGDIPWVRKMLAEPSWT